VFLDLGFAPEEAEHLLIRSDLLILLQKEITTRGLNRAQAARTLRLPLSRFRDLQRGRVDLFTTDALIDMLARLGVRVRFVPKGPRRRLKVA
jgi:predicted XRE-type DNA-binding protein